MENVREMQEILIRKMNKLKDRLLYEVKQGNMDVEVEFGEEPGEYYYYHLIDGEKLFRAVKEAITKILGHEVKVSDVYKKEENTASVGLTLHCD